MILWNIGYNTVYYSITSKSKLFFSLNSILDKKSKKNECKMNVFSARSIDGLYIDNDMNKINYEFIGKILIN
jgi:hypothetical protein